jgi:hypothetical protein
MRGLLVVSVLALGLPLVAANPGGRCDSGGNPGVGVLVIGGVLYVMDAHETTPGLVGIWVESNGAAGIQRGAASPVFGEDPCADPDVEHPDLRIF